MDQCSKIGDSAGMVIDVFLQIAPLCGVSPVLFDRQPIRQRVLMGDFEKPERSINGKKTWIGLEDEAVVSHFNAEFDAQEAAMKAGGTKDCVDRHGRCTESQVYSADASAVASGVSEHDHEQGVRAVRGSYSAVAPLLLECQSGCESPHLSGIFQGTERCGDGWTDTGRNLGAV